MGKHQRQGPLERERVVESLSDNEVGEVAGGAAADQLRHGVREHGCFEARQADVVIAFEQITEKEEHQHISDTAGTAWSDSMNMNILATLRRCKLSLIHMSRGGGDCPTLKPPTRARPRNPCIFEMLSVSSAGPEAD